MIFGSNKQDANEMLDKVLSLMQYPGLILTRSPPFVTASSWAIYDGNRIKKLFGKNSSAPREVASLTKIMTAYTVKRLAEENVVSFKDKVRVTLSASNVIGTHSGLRCGDTISVSDLMYGLMLPSGNDAA